MRPHDDSSSSVPLAEAGARPGGRAISGPVAVISLLLAGLLFAAGMLWFIVGFPPPTSRQARAPEPSREHEPIRPLSAEMTDLVTRAGMTPDTGRMAPALEFRGLDGAKGSLVSLRGKVVLIAFWGTSCAPCMTELPELDEIAGRLEPNGLVVLPICMDDSEGTKCGEVLGKVAPRLRGFVDSGGSARDLLHVRHIPQAFLIGPDGRILGRSFGNTRWAGSAMDRLLTSCLETSVGKSSPGDAL